MEWLSYHWTEFVEFYTGGFTEICQERLGLVVKIWQK
jgi:hypothetical protein